MAVASNLLASTPTARPLAAGLGEARMPASGMAQLIPLPPSAGIAKK